MKTKKTARILIALDYNPTAQKVAEQGYALAQAMEAEVTLLHVTSEPINFNSVGHVTVMGFADYPQTEQGNLQVDSVEAINKASKEYLEKTKQHLGNKEINTIVQDGDLGDTILAVAGKIKADIIVLGSHSQKWLENIIMGSVAEKVLRLTTIPLFIVPTKKKD
ncbi:MAG: universal stress protein [Salinivirgaceae bacterium]|nr:universal stress protein [Salinivirgaceae bacterium]MDD4746530.1 universal stress protein [Salinivirgaceae bacterium]MDY0281739.1 universal stress protein [Salinivirgaceae bacterium]